MLTIISKKLFHFFEHFHGCQLYRAGDYLKIIKEPTKNIALLWQRPTSTQDVYRPMKFLLKAQVEDGLLLYNVVTSEMVLLDGTEICFFDGDAKKYTSSMDELITRHFLVPDDFNENRSVQQLRAVLKKMKPPRRVAGFTILPTTECNARCYYCFESDHPRYTMTGQIADDTVAYIAEKCKGEPIEITWFGGEPLVGAKQITRICAGLREKEIKYRSSIVSNAYLFDESLVQRAKNEWNVNLVQITLDGTETVYNEAKAYVKPSDNPYYRVLKSIDLLLDQGIAVNVRLNVTANNAEDLSNLIDELASRFGGRKGFTCYSHAVYEDVGFSPISYDEYTREWVDAQTIALDTKLREKKLLGSFSKLPVLHTVHCMADNDTSLLIYPDGTIGKCENKSSLEGVGNIYRGIDEMLAGRYKETREFSDCDNCPLFPDCVNVSICPETGSCSSVKVEWKVDRYTALMRELYQKYLQKKLISESLDADQSECNS